MRENAEYVHKKLQAAPHVLMFQLLLQLLRAINVPVEFIYKQIIHVLVQLVHQVNNTNYLKKKKKK